MSGNHVVFDSRKKFVCEVGANGRLTFVDRIVIFRREVLFMRGNLVSDPGKNPSKDWGSRKDAEHLCEVK